MSSCLDNALSLGYKLIESGIGELTSPITGVLDKLWKAAEANNDNKYSFMGYQIDIERKPLDDLYYFYINISSSDQHVATYWFIHDRASGQHESWGIYLFVKCEPGFNLDELVFFTKLCD